MLRVDRGTIFARNRRSAIGGLRKTRERIYLHFRSYFLEISRACRSFSDVSIFAWDSTVGARAIDNLCQETRRKKERTKKFVAMKNFADLVGIVGTTGQRNHRGDDDIFRVTS